jgi:hypothetical protein
MNRLSRQPKNQSALLTAVLIDPLGAYGTIK